MAFKPSKYNLALFNWVEKLRGSCVVIAVAGSGKTTSIVRSLEFIPVNKYVLVLAFNADIAAEIDAKIREFGKEIGRAFSRVSARTFHSAALYNLRKHLGGVVNTDGTKCRKLCREWLGDYDYDLYQDFICRLVDLAKGQGVGCLVPDTEEVWYEMIQHHDLMLEAEEADEAKAVSLARQLLQLSNERAKTGYIDFNDMLYLPLLWKLRMWQNDWVIIDEAQDTNPVRRAIAKLALRPGGRLMAVGDDRQAIYGFTGASHDAIELIKREFNCIELELSVSYRCPRSVVELAQTIVPRILSHDAAVQGEVLELELNDALARLDSHDAVLCRNTAPLITLAYKLLGQGVACKVLGREIGEGLSNLVKKMKAKGIDDLIEKLENWRARETAKFMAKGEEGKAEAISDRYECVITVIDNLPEGKARTISMLLERINTLFSNENGCLTLSTIHKAKGKEWRRVLILDRWRMPSKFARQDWQQLQEQNIEYVAYTRAMLELLFADLPRKTKVQKKQEAVA